MKKLTALAALVSRIVAGALWRFSEFQAGLTGACGPNALAMLLCWYSQAANWDTGAVYRAMRAAALCDPNGPSVMGGLVTAAKTLYKLPVAEYRLYMGDTWAGWRAFLDKWAGSAAVLIEVANGQALYDAVHGTGENARGLRYHFVLIVGYHAGGYCATFGREMGEGWIVLDGDNFAGGNVPQFYTNAVLSAAKPCAAMAVPGKVAATMGWTRRSDHGAQDSAGHVAGWGMADYIFSHGITADALENESYVGGTASYLALTDGRILVYTKAANAVTEGPAAAALLVSLASQLDAANAQVADLAAKIAAETGTNTKAAAVVAAVGALVNALKAAGVAA